MEPTSLTNDKNMIEILEAQVRECYGRVVYSHKTHEKCCDILLGRLSIIKIIQIILSALTTGGFILIIWGDGKEAAIIGAIFSTILLVLNAYTKNYNLGEIAQKHKQAANDIWLIREQYLSLLTDIAVGQKPFDKLVGERDRLLQSLYKVYSGAPSTNLKAYKKAQNALKKCEELTFCDEEIDVFLPQKLRKSQDKSIWSSTSS